MNHLMMPTFVLSWILIGNLAMGGDEEGTEREDAALSGVAKLMDEAKRLGPLWSTSLSHQFLDQTPHLPRIRPRTIYRGEDGWVAEQMASKWPQEQREAARPFIVDEERYYNTFYGTPLVYGRLLEIIGGTGVTDLRGRRVLDFGYGSVGHLRLMALCGADAVGTEVSSALQAMYSKPTDQGTIKPASIGSTKDQSKLGNNSAVGRVTLVHGRWPGDEEIVKKTGGRFDIITSKNTLKNGYINPAREVDPRMLVDLGVSNEAFVKALYDALNPGGYVLIYNLCPAMPAEDEPYIPWADGRSPFTKEQWAAAGFEIIKFDECDDKAVRQIFKTLGHPTTKEDGSENLFAWYTLVRRPR